ncbi:MAG TPA: carboxypeptidase-like regulatory domain-containing protein [Candidatus Eremiobacteraceae bacterium]|nr:carboxypeptidase-like regulatory domain-containing protein [Candidatus Eremiobacteraceae bacterium]
MSKALLAVVFYLVVLIADVVPSSAGTTGVINGRVTDASTGLPVSGIAVTVISNVDIESTETDANGFYSFVSLPPGDYFLLSPPNVSTIGYRESCPRVMARVSADQTTAADLLLVRPPPRMFWHCWSFKKAGPDGVLSVM